MYFTRIKKSKVQLEIMIDALTLEYGAKDDNALAELLTKYFEVSLEDATITLQTYKAGLNEDYEMQSNRIEYAKL